MTQMDPETSKNQIGMLKTFEIDDFKPNWQKKFSHAKNVQFTFAGRS